MSQLTAALPEPAGAAEVSMAEEGPWSHLLRWEQCEDDDHANLAALDELEEEDESDALEDEEQDLEQEQEQENETERTCQSQTRPELSVDAILEIINERIAHYTSLWVPNKGVPREDHIEYDPEEMWEDAESKGLRKQLETGHKAELEYFTHRLDTLCAEIIKFPGPNAMAIRRQCNNLEVTINNMELNRWLMSIYELAPESGSNVTEDPEDGVVDLGSPPQSSMSDIAIRDGEQTIIPDVEIVDTIEADISTSSNALPSRPSMSGSLVDYGDEPEHASITTVRRWDWEELIMTQDRKRILTKVVYELRAEDREDIRTRLELVGRVTLGKEIKACIDMLSRDQSRMQGVLPRDLPKIIIFSNLFTSWWLSDNFFLNRPSRERLEELIRYGPADFEVFFDFLSVIMGTTFSKEALQHPDRPSQAEIIEISDDDDDVMHVVTTQVPDRTASTKPPGSQRMSAIVLD